MAKTRAEIEEQRKALDDELAALDVPASPKADDPTVKKTVAKLEGQIARASEDSIAEASELMRHLIALLEGKAPQPPDDAKEDKRSFFDKLLGE
jgi:hypothetical protein